MGSLGQAPTCDAVPCACSALITVSFQHHVLRQLTKLVPLVIVCVFHFQLRAMEISVKALEAVHGWAHDRPNAGFLDVDSPVMLLSFVLWLLLRELGLSLQIQSCTTLWQSIQRAEWMATAAEDNRPACECLYVEPARVDTLCASEVWHPTSHVKQLRIAGDLKGLMPGALKAMVDLCEYTLERFPFDAAANDDNTNKAVNMIFCDALNVMIDVAEHLGCDCTRLLQRPVLPSSEPLNNSDPADMSDDAA